MGLFRKLFGRRKAGTGRVRLPKDYDLNDPVHCLLLDDIREKFGKLMGDETHEFAGCMYRPASMLPYPREEIRKALGTLLDWVEGRRESKILDDAARSEEAAGLIRTCLAYLEDYVDVPADELPHEPMENVRAVAKWRSARENQGSVS